MLRLLLVLGLFVFCYSNKLAADSPAAILINQATLGNNNDSDATEGAVGGGKVSHSAVFINVASPPFFNPIPKEIQDTCAKMETPEQKFSRVTDQKNDSMDFVQFLQLDACSVAWRKQDFNKIDTNNDSKISADEWNAYNQELINAAKQAQLSFQKLVFSRLDSNNDNLLSKKELKKYLKDRMINSGNLTKYLNGRKLNFTQFSDFDGSIPNATFPFKIIYPEYDYSAPFYAYDYPIPDDSEIDDNVQVDPLPNKPQPRPAILPGFKPIPLPTKNDDGQMSIQIQPPIANGVGVQHLPAIFHAVEATPLPVVIPTPKNVEGQMSIQNEPQVAAGPPPAASDKAANVMSAPVMPPS